MPFFRDISIYFLILSLFAEIFGTIGGFGSSVFFVPIANFYFDFESVLGLTAIYHLSSNLSKIFVFKQGLDKRLILTIGIPSVLFVIVGGILTNFIQTKYLEVVLGFFLVILSLLFIIRKELVILPTTKNAITGGILSGFSAGLMGTGGAIRGLTMAAFNMDKSKFIATSAFIDFLIDFSRAFVYYESGYIHEHDFMYIPFLILIGIFGTLIGKKILNYIPQDKFKFISLLLILLIGSITLIKAFIL